MPSVIPSVIPWTIFRFILFLLPLAWLVSLPTSVEIALGSWRISSRIGVLLFLLLALMLVLWLLLMSLREVLSLPHNLQLWRGTRRQKAGYQALLSSLSDIGSSRALKSSLAARRLLDNNPLSTLIAAQVAEATNEHEQAMRLYESLIAVKETSFVSLLALARLSRASGELDKARAYIERAQALQPNSQQLQSEQIEIAQQDGSPQVAISILEKMRARGRKLPAPLRQLEARLRIDLMRKALEAGEQLEALRQAECAYRVSTAHGIIPYAQRLADGNAVDKALGRKIILARWSKFAARELAETFFRLNDATKPIERVRLFENLIGNKASLKSRLLLCELLLDARLWARAEHILDEDSMILDNPEPDKTARQKLLPELLPELLPYLRIRARLAKEAHNDLAAQQRWLDRLAQLAEQTKQEI